MTLIVEAGTVVMSVVMVGAGSLMVAVARGVWPSGQLRGGITYVTPSEQQMAPGGTH